MPGLSKKETAKLLDYIEPQGVDITPVKNGYLLRLPNGETTTVHLSVSDHRGPANLKATLKRAGVKWPTDSNYGGSRSGIQHEHTKKFGEKLLLSFNYAEVIKASDLRLKAQEIGWNPTSNTIRKFMISKGYQSIGATSGLKWKKITPIVTERKELIEQDNVAEIVSINSETPNPLDRVIKETPREFLDTHDSWTINLDILPHNLSLGDTMMMLKAMGLKFEIRVWK
jgi:hypothetical protein